jgi:RHS repeat-associated protein
MTQDKHKGCTIQYNYLNLPIVFTKGTNVITMTYTTVKHHLGNARVNFRAAGTSIVNIEDHHYYPFGMKMEGIGSTTVTNKYTYNGKELNDDFGLNLHDYGARWYDTALGRWWSADPLGEKMPRWSTYNYGFDNPLRFVDPTGMESEGYSSGLTGLAKEESDKVKQEQEQQRERERIKNFVDNALNGRETPTASAKMGIMVKEKSSGVELARISSTVTTEWDDKQQKYANPSTLNNGSSEGPFSKISHVDRTIREIDGQMIFSFRACLKIFM